MRNIIRNSIYIRGVKKLIVAQLVNKFPVFPGIRWLINFFTGTGYWTVSRANWFQPTSCSFLFFTFSFVIFAKYFVMDSFHPTQYGSESTRYQYEGQSKDHISNTCALAVCSSTASCFCYLSWQINYVSWRVWKIRTPLLLSATGHDGKEGLSTFFF